MNKLQQEIKVFHENILPALEKVLQLYDKGAAPKIYEAIIKPCKKLIQKCSFKSLSDTSSLCAVTYWLYIYGHKALALEICELTHGIEFGFEYRESSIINIYGLEIRIARELLGENRRDAIPLVLSDYYFSKRVKKELRYPQVLREEKIAACGDRFLNTELLYALYNMIGKGETGLYTDLNNHWQNIENAINAYIAYLKQE